MPYICHTLAKIKKTFRITPEAAVKVESADNETEFVENAIMQYQDNPIVKEEQKIEIKRADGRFKGIKY